MLFAMSALFQGGNLTIGRVTGNSNPTIITMDANKYVTAVFLDGTIPPPLPKKEVVDYFIQWCIYRRDYHMKNIVSSGSADTLTVINYAFAGIGDNLKCETLDCFADYNKRYDPGGALIHAIGSGLQYSLKRNWSPTSSVVHYHQDLAIRRSIPYPTTMINRYTLHF